MELNLSHPGVKTIHAVHGTKGIGLMMLIYWWWQEQGDIYLNVPNEPEMLCYFCHITKTELTEMLNFMAMVGLVKEVEDFVFKFCLDEN